MKIQKVFKGIKALDISNQQGASRTKFDLYVILDIEKFVLYLVAVEIKNNPGRDISGNLNPVWGQVEHLSKGLKWDRSQASELEFVYLECFIHSAISKNKKKRVSFDLMEISKEGDNWSRSEIKLEVGYREKNIMALQLTKALMEAGARSSR